MAGSTTPLMAWPIAMCASWMNGVAIDGTRTATSASDAIGESAAPVMPITVAPTFFAATAAVHKALSD